jgi:FixJ family two-component response regulator
MEKPASDQVLIDRVQQALELDRRTRASLARRSDAAARYARLSKREREVVKFITAGKANKVIAAELGLSGKTVEAHRTAIMRKLDVHSVPDLVRLELLAGDAEIIGESPRTTGSIPD